MPKQRFDEKLVLARILREGAYCELRMGECVALIASRLLRPYDDERAARNRVRTNMANALKLGIDASRSGLAKLPNGKLTCDEIARWAHIYCKGSFGDLPMAPLDAREHVVESLGMRSSTSSQFIPGNIEVCQQELILVRKELERFRLENAARMVENGKRRYSPAQKALVLVESDNPLNKNDFSKILGPNSTSSYGALCVPSNSIWSIALEETSLIVQLRLTANIITPWIAPSHHHAPYCDVNKRHFEPNEVAKMGY